MNYSIRNEVPSDYNRVEEITRNAFWDLYVPGCNEHFLAHVMRDHPDFIPELDFVIEIDGVVAGNIMYTRSRLVGRNGNEKAILTFGPVSILPEYQRKGYGRALISHSFEKAIRMNYDAIVIFGNPRNYVSLGFRSCVRYGVAIEGGTYPSAMLVKELRDGALEGEKWIYHESEVYQIDECAAQKFDGQFPKREKCHRASQEEFDILSHSQIIA